MKTAAQDALPLDRLPGPPALPLIGNLHQMDTARLHLDLERWAAQYGPLFRVRLGPRTRVCIADIDVINDMLRERPERYRRPRVTETVMAEMGFHGVFSQDGDAWRRQRRVVAHALNPAHLERFYPSMARTTGRLLERWRAAATADAPVDLCRDLMRYTVDVTAHLAFGIDVNTLETDGPVIQQHLDKVFPMLFRRVIAPFPYWRYWRSAADRELDAALAGIRETVIGFTAECRQRMRRNPALYDAPGNFLEAMIAAQRAEDVEFSDAEIYANVIQLLLAGEDTTANTIAWAIRFFIEHPELLARARAEADAVFGSHATAPDLDAVRQLTFIDAFAHETMRLKPVAPILGLEPKEDVEVLGYRIPAGTAMLALTRVNAVSDTHFGDPLVFDPGRWLVDASPTDAPHNPRAFMPFGAGPRFCPGRGLAMVEIKSVLGMLCHHFEPALAAPGTPITERLAFTMLPENLSVRLTARRSPAGMP